MDIGEIENLWQMILSHNYLRPIKSNRSNLTLANDGGCESTTRSSCLLNAVARFADSIVINNLKEKKCNAERTLRLNIECFMLH